MNIKSNDHIVQYSELQKRFLSVIETMDDAIIITDSEFVIQMWNRQAQEIFGYTRNEIIGKSMLMLFPGDNSKACEDMLKNSSITNSPAKSNSSEFAGITQDGGIFPLKITFLKWISDENIYYTLILRDVSELKNAEDILIKKQEELGIRLKYESLLANISSRLNTNDDLDIVLKEIVKKISLVTRIDEVRLYFLYEKDDTFKLKPGEEITGFPEIVYSITPFIKIDRLIDVIKNGNIVISGDLSEYSKEEKENINELGLKSFLLMPVRIAEKVPGMLMFGKKVEFEWTPSLYGLLKTIADIIANSWERNNNFNAKLKAEQKQIQTFRLAEQSSRLASLGTLAAGMAHEINQPLTAMKITVDGMMYWEEMNQKIPEDEILPSIEFISDQISRIEEIITQIRVLAKADKPETEEPIKINNILDQSLSLIKAQLAAHKIKISLELGESLPEILGIPSQIRRAFTNLVINSMHALDNIAKDNKRIIISTASDNENCYIEMQDNGPGIPEEYIDHIFDPFFTTKISTEGMGLGLAIAQNIISGFGGGIIVENLTAGGVKFTVSIPVSN
ncbi:MAG: PAS domain S-box protein [bacterium]|nr:PAS domain S-box protein [bacterium]